MRVLFLSSRRLEQQHIYLDDDLIEEQLEKARGLLACRLGWKGRGWTWLRQDTLMWSDAAGQHQIICALTLLYQFAVLSLMCDAEPMPVVQLAAGKDAQDTHLRPFSLGGCHA